MDPPSPSTRDSRPRLLYSCGASFLAISHKALQRMERFDNPLGFMSRTFTSIVTPIAYPLARQWLWSLSFFDDRILSIEDKVMFVIPQSAQLFFALDQLAVLADSLPKQVDDTIDRLPSLLREVPLLKPLLSSIVTSQEWGNEKDIVVDVDDKETTAKHEMEDEDNDARQKKTYKEILEGSKENEIVEENRAVVAPTDVPILELLDEGWGMRSLAGKKDESAQELVETPMEKTEGLPSTEEGEDHVSESAVQLGDGH